MENPRNLLVCFLVFLPCLLTMQSCQEQAPTDLGQELGLEFAPGALAGGRRFQAGITIPGGFPDEVRCSWQMPGSDCIALECWREPQRVRILSMSARQIWEQDEWRIEAEISADVPFRVDVLRARAVTIRQGLDVFEVGSRIPSGDYTLRIEGDFVTDP